MQLKSYFNYLKKRVDAHGIHSPFVFELYNEVLLKASQIDDKAINQLRRKLKKNTNTIRVEDFGAGSKLGSNEFRKISNIAKTASVNKKFGRLLAKLISHYKLEYAIELGTSLGIGTSYIAMQPTLKKVISLEGASEIAAIASTNFKELGVNNKIELLIGEFDTNLAKAVELLPKIDLVYIDGNHQYQATIDYFNFFIEHVNDDTFLIFDDIYWSEGMTKAWEEIIASPKINVSMDLFRMGMVCKRPKQAKQHFILKY